MTQNIVTPKRALISLSDKTSLERVARILDSKGVELLSTGGTAKSLADLGIKVIDVHIITIFLK